MRWTALDVLGSLVRFDGARASFPSSAFVAEFSPYVPVAASDPDTGITLTAARDGLVDSVHYLDSRGYQGKLAESVTGKWPIAIVRKSAGRFLVAWISSRTMDAVTLADMTANANGYAVSTTTRAISTAAVLTRLSADGSLQLDNTDAGYDVRPFVRAGRTWNLIYWQEVNGRVVGVDGEPGAPNRVVLGDSDGWYIVTDENKSALFPPRVDMNGNVATFEGDYFTNADIRSRVVVQDTTPRIPEFVPARPVSAETEDNAALLAVLGLVLLFLAWES